MQIRRHSNNVFLFIDYRYITKIYLFPPLETRRLRRLLHGRAEPSDGGFIQDRGKRDRAMNRDVNLLIVGLGPFASSLARMALLAGCAVALHQPDEPKILRRRMSYADAWSDGAAMLAGVEARLARDSRRFIAALRAKSSIPLLAGPLAEDIGRWPWDAIVDARVEDGAQRTPLPFDAPLRIGLGPGPVVGPDCDLVVATGGRDPGAVFRAGGESPAPTGSDGLVLAPVTGVFHCAHDIGDWVGRRFILGAIDGRIVLAPKEGFLAGQRRSGALAQAGEAVAEIVRDQAKGYMGLGRVEQQVARAVLFALEAEMEGWPQIAIGRAR
jgi:xanthine dehydrogenase accessory factor